MRLTRLYLITGPGGKRYVGITTKSIRSRFGQHRREAARGVWKSALHDAIQKYGIESFSIEELAVFPTWEDGCAAEIKTINKLGTIGDGGYNLAEGGAGHPGCRHSDEFKEYISRVHLGKVVGHTTRMRLRLVHSERTPEQREAYAAKMSAANARRSPEERARISEAISASKRGKRRPAEVVRKVTAARWRDK